MDVEWGIGTYWERHVHAVAKSIERDTVDLPIVLVGHSGAGPLLPSIAEAIKRPVAGLVFVDAGIPRAGASRLDLLAKESGTDIAGKLRGFLEGGGSYPAWREEELKNLIPDAATRREVMEEVQPRPLAFWQETIPVPVDWCDIPCGYLRLSHGYSVPGAEAQQLGWPYRELDAGHFHMVVDPEGVAFELIELLAAMGVSE